MKVKYLMMVAVAAASTLMVSAAPRPAVAETASVATVAAGGMYPIYDSSGKLIGYVFPDMGEVIKPHAGSSAN